MTSARTADQLGPASPTNMPTTASLPVAPSAVGVTTTGILSTGLLSALMVFILLAPAAGLRTVGCGFVQVAHSTTDGAVAAGHPGDEVAGQPHAERHDTESFVVCSAVPRWRRIEEGGLPPSRAP